MPWRETCRMDERMRFVLSCAAGEESFSALCRGYGVSRRTGYKWLERYRASGPVGLVDRSRAPHANCQTLSQLPAIAGIAVSVSIRFSIVRVGPSSGERPRQSEKWWCADGQSPRR